MSDKEMLLILERENQRLKQDNEMLQKTIVQMRSTLNRLIARYITESRTEH